MSKIHMWCTASAFALVAVATTAPTAAMAQNTTVQAPAATEEEVIFVTAQRREELQVDVPISITSLTQDQLETANVETLADIARVTPGLRFDNQSQFAQPSIRGIGTGITTSGGGANVGVYIDGFYSPNPIASDTELLNVRSIQVLKGPQGTLFGRNTTGGAILVQTAEPSETPGGEIKASYARFDQWRGQGYLTAGLAPGLAVDIEGSYRRGDGFQTNIVDGNDEIGKYENWSVRTGIKMEFSPDVSLLIRYTHNDIDDPTSVLTNSFVDPVLGVTAPLFAPPSLIATDPDLVAVDRPTFFTSVNNIVQATLRVDLGIGDFTSYTQYRTEDVNASTNLDNSGFPLFQLGLPIENETWSQEFLLTSKPGTRLQWTAGLFYFSNRDTYFTFADTGGAFRDPFGPTRLGGSSTTTETYAAFLDATYEVTPRLFITAGARYAHDTVEDAYYNIGPREIPVTGISGNKITPRVVVRYKPTEDSSIYASYAKGYKAAIIDVGGTCQNPPAFTCNDVQPEEIDAYEVGFKYDNRRLALEASAYYYDYKQLQVSLFTAGRAAIVNAASSEIYGAEGAVRYELSDAFKINAGAAYTRARYKRFEDAPIYQRCPAPAGCGGGTSFFNPPGITLTDVTMQRTPEFTGNIGASYEAILGGGELQLSGNLYYTSSFFFGPSGIQFPQKGYEVLSLRGQWTDPSDTFTLAVFGDNVTNNRYRTQVQYNNFGIGSTWNPPITYGVEVGVRF